MTRRDYEIEGFIYRASGIDVSRARRKSDDARVVLKQATGSAGERSAARLHYEYRVLEKLRHAGALGVPSVLEFIDGEHPTLVMADIDGSPLRAPDRGKIWAVDEALFVIAEVSGILAAIHRAFISHKDINPNNIVYNAKTKRVQVIDLGIASALSHEMQVASAISAVEGTLAYVSPEQTGRINRLLDYRTDFYSLGVTFYELLVGCLPFTQEDPSELMHAILTKAATPVKTLRPEVPAPISDIIELMMAKSPDDRYQSATGLQADLQRCIDNLRATGQVTAFELRANDRSERFEVPQTLFGRSTEGARVRASLSEAMQGKRRLLLVRGPSGIGKSALVTTELQVGLLARRGFMAQGKHDQLHRHIPFAAFSSAMAGVMRRILLDDSATIEGWRQRAQDALGAVARVVTDVVPSLEMLIGPQPPVAELPPSEVEARLIRALERFVGMLCERAPLVLFLDDLQWADPGTLKLIKLLCLGTEPVAGLLIVGAYRDNEVDGSHPLSATLNELAKADVQPDVVNVGPLGLEDVTALVLQATRSPLMAAAALSRVVVEKTAGNPFFVREFLTYLCTEGLLTLDPATGAWQSDLDKVRLAGVTDNVVDLMTQKLKRLPSDEQRLASIAACLGGEFSLAALSTVSGRAPADVAGSLSGMLEAAFIFPLSRSYRYLSDGAELENDVRYRFAHDRIQQAAVGLLGPAELSSYHAQIGRSLLKHHAGEAAEGWVFEVVNHLNASETLLTAEEKIALGKLNLVAAHESTRAMAYEVGLGHCERGVALLGTDAWNTHYPVMRALQLEASDDEFLLSRTPEARKRLEVLLSHSQSALERAEVQRRRCVALTSMGLWREAIDAALDGLDELGFKLSRKPSMLIVLPRLLRAQRKFASKSSSEWANAPLITDERQLMVVRILNAYLFAAFVSDPVMWLYTSLWMLDLTMKLGNSNASAYAYGAFAPVLVKLNNYVLADTAAALAMQLLKQIPDSTSPAFVALCNVTFVQHVLRTPAETAELYREAYRLGVDTGDPVNGGINAMLEMMALQQMSLHQADEAIKRYDRYVMEQRNFNAPMWLPRRQTNACLMGRTSSNLSFDDAEYREARDAATFPTPGFETVHLGYKAWVWLLHGDLDQAMGAVSRILELKAFDSIEAATNTLVYYIIAMVLTSHALDKKQHLQHASGLRMCRSKFRVLGKAGKVYRGYSTLVDAQLAAAAGKEEHALMLYTKACDELDAHGFRHAAAMAHERAARFCVKSGLQTLAQTHARLALQAYQTWGATVKTGLLKTEWTDLLAQHEAASLPANATSTRTNIWNGNLDVMTLMQVAQSLSVEVSLSKLVVRIMDSMRETAGADRAALLLRRGTSLVVAADTAEGQIAIGDVSEVNGDKLPVRVLKYVANSGETIVIDDATNSSELGDDPYLKARSPKSLLCAPLLHQGKVLALIYLENHVLDRAFTEERLLSVNLIATQGAISLENAYVYSHLEETVNERTEALKAANEKVVRLERDMAERQMAGGFAHEMRNALNGAQFILQTVVGAPESDAVLSESGRCLEALNDAVMPLVPEQQRNQIENLVGDLAQKLISIETSLGQVDEAMGRGQKITTMILDYAQLGHVVVRQQQAVSVSEVLQRLMREFEGDLGKHAITAQVDVGQKVQVAMEENHFYAILRNLMANARDAMSDSRKNKTLSVTATVEDNRVVVSVADSGHGIPSQMQHRIFEPFFSTKGALGTGLGLGVSRKLAVLYGGDITFESQAEVGTTFRVTIPTERP